MKPTYEQLEQERDELAAQVERLRGDLGKCVSDLKAQWQAEAFTESAAICESLICSHTYDIEEDALHCAANAIRQRAQEAGNE